VVCRDGFLSLTLPTGVYAEEISVFDMNGRLVFRFRPSAGMQMSSFRWDGLPANGMKLRPGRYIVRVRTTAGNVLTQSVSWVR
jgi:flagellar hook assembly protein FlgD